MTAHGAAVPTAIDQHLALNTVAPAVSHSIEYRSLLDGDAGTFQTLDAMRDAVLGRIGPDYSGFSDPYNIRAAKSICGNLSGPPGHERRQIAALFSWVINNITYEPHPINQQTLQDARRTLELRKADCVSLSVLLATLALCLGVRPRFVAQWINGEPASHVYVEVLLNDGSELALDAVAKDQPIGWRQPKGDNGFEFAQEIFNG